MHARPTSSLGAHRPGRATGSAQLGLPDQVMLLHCARPGWGKAATQASVWSATASRTPGLTRPNTGLVALWQRIVLAPYVLRFVPRYQEILVASDRDAPESYGRTERSLAGIKDVADWNAEGSLIVTVQHRIQLQSDIFSLLCVLKNQNFFNNEAVKKKAKG
ncbi:hypothetical protein NDU88_001804 [Pleurodeles waltl]|uniref:Uncharacterized protein n=1 Tax=Pleurodeles waltl TaxID=8319 RepID=A0AAV7NBT8_PLEWA|nr:hypothetical protein NDU88_001804 [Pleurodeles waltl]